MDPALIRAGVDTLQAEELALQRRLKTVREGVATLQALCAHRDVQNKGHDPRGAGRDYYACPDCKKEWSE